MNLPISLNSNLASFSLNPTTTNLSVFSKTLSPKIPFQYSMVFVKFELANDTFSTGSENVRYKLVIKLYSRLYIQFKDYLYLYQLVVAQQ